MRWSVLLMATMLPACVSPRLLVRHTDDGAGVVAVSVDDIDIGTVAPGGTLSADVMPGERRVGVRRSGRSPVTIPVWVEGTVEVEIVDLAEPDGNAARREPVP